MTDNELTRFNKRTFLTYILITLGFTWVCWIPALMWADQGVYPLPTIANLAQETPYAFADQ